MSGHSKWHNIQARKGKQDAMRSGQFTKISKLITIAAKNGGDPAMNFALRLATERAKDIGMPKDNIERAIKRGTGELAGDQIEEVLYECYGPAGVAVLVKCLTDNKNRSVSDLKHIFSKHGGSMAGAGSVQWMFGQWGVVEIEGSALQEKSMTIEDFELKMAENGAEDIKIEENIIEIKSKIEHFQKVLGVVKGMDLKVVESGLRWEAKDKISVSAEIEESLGSLFAELEENDDVEDYFTNAA